MVWWAMRNTRILPVDLRGLLENFGFGRIEVPEIDPVSTLRAVAEGMRWPGTDGQVYAKVADVDEYEVTIGFLRTEKTDKKRLRGVQIDTVTYHRLDGSFQVERGCKETSEFINRAEDWITHLNARWIRPNVVQRVLREMRAFYCHTGVWYVPAQYHEELANLQALVNSIGSSRLFVATLQRDDNTGEAIRHSVEHSLGGQLEELHERFERWEKSTRKIKSNSADGALEILDQLMDDASLYELSLGVLLDDLKVQIGESKRRALELIQSNLESHGKAPVTSPAPLSAPIRIEEPEFPPEPGENLSNPDEIEMRIYTTQQAAILLLEECAAGRKTFSREEAQLNYGDSGKKAMDGLVKHGVIRFEPKSDVGTVVASDVMISTLLAGVSGD